jgi:quercetin dioxygenase-like cupin family protein
VTFIGPELGEVLPQPQDRLLVDQRAWSGPTPWDRAISSTGGYRRNVSKPLVVNEIDVEREAWSDSRGQVGFRTIFGGLNVPGDFTAGVTDLDVGGWLGHHRHEPAELYYVLDGEGTLTIDGEDHAVSAGMAAYIPGNSEHGIRNTGTSPMRFFYAFAVASFDEIEYRFTTRQ